jgi:NADP-dependent 3-hydroxy acid dehydrogenase YdfG
MVATDFGDSITDQAVRAAMGRRVTDTAIPPDAIARGILYVLEQPPEVDIGCIVIRPTAQD